MKRLLGWYGVLACAVVAFGQEPGSLVLQWNELALRAIRAETTGPTASTRNLAILHCALYDAVNSITRARQPYRFAIDCPKGASVEAAVAACGCEILKVIYPSVKARADDLRKAMLKSIGDETAVAAGTRVGEEIATRMLAVRTDDGSNTQVPYIPKRDPGQWRRTLPYQRPPTDPQWGSVKLFALPDRRSFLPPPPPPLESADYATAYNEVKAVGGKKSKARTKEQSDIATFWSDFSYTAMPPGHWQEIAADIVRERGTTLAETARLFALLSLAQADAAIVCWEIKYSFNSWRPVTAINRADEDDNPATEKDEAWQSFLVSPSFPEYTSGHSTFSKASAQILKRFFGTDTVHFTVRSDSLPGVTRVFDSFAACADEVGISRIYGGIHFQFSNVEGKRCGEKIGDYISEHCLLPL